MQTNEKLLNAVKAYQNGDVEAFTTIYEESKKYIYVCIYKIVNGRDNATDIISDIMQDTYIEISKELVNCKNPEVFLSWAGTIANRKCYAFLKKDSRYVLLDEEDNTFEQLSDDEKFVPESVLQDKEKQRLLRDIINKELSEMQKLCVIGYFYNEQKQSEIAKELGIPENTVKTNLSRAKAKIRDSVLNLEKKKGTRLYSIAPLMLLLFKDEVKAALVPAKISSAVLSNTNCYAASTAVVEGTKMSAEGTGFFAKIAGMSLKAKIITGVATLAVVGGVTTAAVVVPGMVSNNEAQVEQEANKTTEKKEETKEEKKTVEEKETEAEKKKEPIDEFTFTDVSNELLEDQKADVQEVVAPVTPAAPVESGNDTAGTDTTTYTGELEYRNYKTAEESINYAISLGYTFNTYFQVSDKEYFWYDIFFWPTGEHVYGESQSDKIIDEYMQKNGSFPGGSGYSNQDDAIQPLGFQEGHGSWYVRKFHYVIK